MKIKQLIDTPSGVSVKFHVDEDGSLIIEMDGESIEIPHLLAMELLHYLTAKLYDHQNANESFLKRLLR